MSTTSLARGALAAAARTRLKAELGAYGSICVYDLAQRMGIDLRFQALPSLEGMYSPGEPPIVILSALRPSGRQRVNCAHEIGHHVFGHGTRLDQLLEDNDTWAPFDPDEFVANCFAEYLLMPKLAVLSALSSRGISLETMEPLDAFRLSSYFGVGYRTLLHHLERNLRSLSSRQAYSLRRIPPKKIRSEVVGHELDAELVVADPFWRGRPIDLQTGDILLLPMGAAIEGSLLNEIAACRYGQLYHAVMPGIARVEHLASAWSAYIRIARRVQGGGFVGRSIYRHEPDTDEYKPQRH